MKKIIFVTFLFSFLCISPLSAKDLQCSKNSSHLQLVSSSLNLYISAIKVKELNELGKETILDFPNSKKPSVVIFISKDCPCSKGNLSYINNLAENFKDFNFIAIHSKKNATEKDLVTYFGDKNLHFKAYNDPDLKIADEFKAIKTPHAFIVNTEGEVIYSGGVTSSTTPEHAKSEFLKDSLNEFLKTKKIEVAKTRTLGCYIVR